MLLANSLAMNTAPVIQTSVQATVGPSSPAGADNTANAGGAQSAFAGALNAAGAKPSRRSGASKQSDDSASGGSLPPAGKQSPPVPAPQAATLVPTPHSNGISPAGRPRAERARANGLAPTENPVAVQAAAAAAMSGGAKSLSGSTSHAAEGNAAAGPEGTITGVTNVATNGTTKNAATFGAVGGQPAMQAKIESDLAANSAATALEAPATAAVGAAAAAEPEAPTPTASLESNLASDSAMTSKPATTADQSARTSFAPAAAALAAASAAADKAAAKPHPAALRPVSKVLGRITAPATDSAAARAGGEEADSAFSKASASSGDTLPASGGPSVPVPTTVDTGTQDAAATAAAAVAGTPQSTNTAKARGDNSYDSDASVGALGAGAGAEAAAALPSPGRSGMRAAAGPLIAPNAANAPLLADAGKHAHAGFDLASLTGNIGDAAAGLSQLNANASVGAPADATPTPALQIHASVDSEDFSQGLSDRVSWMVDNGVNGAKLQVNPPQLGPIELRISVQGDHAQVWMTTHSAVARDALESSSPKLREMLNAQGFGQVSVDISQRSFQDRSAYTPPYQRESTTVRSAAVTPAAPTTAASTSRSLLGALDAYA
jgi:flagellar hook-length control protein FliK